MAYFTTADNNFSCSKWIVNPIAGLGTHTTISAALSDASSGDTIYIYPATYTENISLKAGVNLCCFVQVAVNSTCQISGKITANYSGSVSITGIRFINSSDYVIEVINSSSVLEINKCEIRGLTTPFNVVDGIFTVIDCYSVLTSAGHLFDQSGGITNFFSFYDNINNRHTAPNNISGGTCNIYNAVFAHAFLTSGNSSLNMNQTRLFPSGNTTNITCGGSGPHFINGCILSSGSASNIVVNNTTTIINTNIFGGGNVISGTGTLNYGNISFRNSSQLSTTTQNPLTVGEAISVGDGSLQIKTGSGDPNSSITSPQGSIYLRDDGSGTSDRAFINTDSSNTWTSITTAS